MGAGSSKPPVDESTTDKQLDELLESDQQTVAEFERLFDADMLLRAHLDSLESDVTAWSRDYKHVLSKHKQREKRDDIYAASPFVQSGFIEKGFKIF